MRIYFVLALKRIYLHPGRQFLERKNDDRKSGLLLYSEIVFFCEFIFVWIVRVGHFLQ